MVEQKPRRSVQRDRRLACAWSALDGQDTAEVVADQLVLRRLDGGDDVAHLARTSALHVGENRVNRVAARDLHGLGFLGLRSRKGGGLRWDKLKPGFGARRLQL